MFHIKDQKSMEFDYHHHDFHKIVVFISGKVTYHIEGKAYKLQPWDILLIGNTEIHKPVIDASEVYERMVLWVYPDFLEKSSSKESDLLSCFSKASQEEYHLLRLNKEKILAVRGLLNNLDLTRKGEDFGHDILKNVLFIQFIIMLNRLFLDSKNSKEEKGIEYDKNISSIINYINANLAGDLSIEDISSKFFMSRYYLMHKFKQETGSSIYSYIIQKRLILAKALIRQGYPMTHVATNTGFGDYSSFVRAFKKNFSMSPREYYHNLQNTENGNIEDMDI